VCEFVPPAFGVPFCHLQSIVVISPIFVKEKWLRVIKYPEEQLITEDVDGYNWYFAASGRCKFEN
jgi:hypothetical protein